MSSAQGIRQVLLGIQVTIFGGILVLVSSGGASYVGLIVAVIGFLISLSGKVADTPV